jgi:hypothetical protein
MNLAIDHKFNGFLMQKVDAFLEEARKMPQVDCSTKHHFGPNLYIREVTMPAGTVVVGKSHKAEHMCVMLSGKMIIVKDDGSRQELVAPMTFVGSPGRKVAYILETTVFQNIFVTNETDIDKLEFMLVDDTQHQLEGE